MSALRETALAEVRSMLARLGALEKLLAGGEPSHAPVTRGEPDMSVPSPFVGIPMESKYAGKCVVCGNAYGVGAAIVYHRELKKAAHLGCGQPAPRGSRQ